MGCTGELQKPNLPRPRRLRSPAPKPCGRFLLSSAQRSPLSHPRFQLGLGLRLQSSRVGRGCSQTPRQTWLQTNNSCQFSQQAFHSLGGPVRLQFTLTAESDWLVSNEIAQVWSLFLILTYKGKWPSVVNSFEGVRELSTYTKHLSESVVGGTEAMKQHGDTRSSCSAPIYMAENSVYPKLFSGLNHSKKKNTCDSGNFCNISRTVLMTTVHQRK